ncbi:acetyl/propionyl/methylcrotonyl-CoA carboxylase subunit alpha [Paracoccus sp. (in: a-proteobacteria)]|uniref:acetyl/propionyl/methylcrotonyl-CoA carboxylase subunit alpha n=1 Tax=Paracoccus sp. TaxID=267 RepID=UPI00396CE519
MFDKILIANRGEIACRVIDTCRRLGISTVAVFSDVDRGARHVAMADQAVHLGGPAPADSYLRGDAIIAAARASGAQAIHPGYGFLSENPDFVDAVQAAGLVFIGPSASAIRAMGLKDAAKALMQEAGVPVVPGYHGADQDPAFLGEQAAAIGYPVLIKAVAGGGGKGMRRVDDAEDFADALASARSEAQNAFGNPVVLIEKYVLQPRHIEVQVFGDGTRAVHLFERDCSLQRRHQKVIEEAPAPGMTAEMRAAMGDAAVRAAEAIGYSGAGTIEFIVDGSDGLRPDRFWFMEMNTRLQVEHPVTEAITGIDLVEWQLRVASGESLPARQEDLSIRGHAFEARLYAEDVPAGFLPATGRLAHLHFPDHARIETGVRTGDAISPWYDPMIAKVVTHGATRAVALRALEQALVDTGVAGSVTNLDFLIALTRHDGFRRGEVDTGLIGRDLEALIGASVPGDRAQVLAVIGLAGLADPAARGGMTLWQPLRRTVAWDGGSAILEVLGPGAARVTLEGPHEVRWQGDRWWVDGDLCRERIVCHRAGVSVFGGHTVHLAALDPLARAGADDGGDGLTRSPMPGLVKAVHVSQGQHVKAGDRLAVLEAMKMEHSLTAARDGIVAEVLAQAGDQVEAGAALIRLDEVTDG